MTLPLYIGGGLTAWLVHIWKNSSQRSSPLHLSRHRSKFPLVGQHSYQGPSLWEDFKSYAALEDTSCNGKYTVQAKRVYTILLIPRNLLLPFIAHFV
ncbi:hypothetical protein TSUD_387300 [Trifolium subterraneum]|uniref:Uncharacterized protein n=1 Tax=Trifolium subterraneum TaxID=3900 RepID=A0A2Z6PFI9_TRISU|nr:hypothetical protein TSUD_387300 [Trifolium subterraneum]